MPLFPPGAPVTVLFDGRPLAGYLGAYLAGGRVFAPVDPVLTRVADRVWCDGTALLIERGDRRVRVELSAPVVGGFDSVYVSVGPVLRALGGWVRFEPREAVLAVRFPPRRVLTMPTPFDAALPSVPPGAVFTPEPVPTPRPIWTGSPLPRRTPLLLPEPPSERSLPFR